MGKLEKALLRLDALERGEGEPLYRLNTAVTLVVTLAYLIAMLSVPLDSFASLIWFAVYPLVATRFYGLRFSRIFLESLYVLPFVAFIGIFNPFFQKDTAFMAGDIAISEGWVSFASIILRGLLAVQAALILISAHGFSGVCATLRRLGMPGFLVTQIQFVYRYLGVLLSEALNMRRAASSRGYGKKSYPLKIWGAMTGQLLIRTIDRGESIHRAMLARGFTGSLPCYGLKNSLRLKTADFLWAAVWIAIFLVLRVVNLSSLFQQF